MSLKKIVGHAKPFASSGSTRRSPPTIGNRGRQSEFEEAPDEFPEVDVGDDLDEEQEPSGGGEPAMTHASPIEDTEVPESEAAAALDEAAEVVAAEIQATTTELFEEAKAAAPAEAPEVLSDPGPSEPEIPEAEPVTAAAADLEADQAEIEEEAAPELPSVVATIVDAHGAAPVLGATATEAPRLSRFAREALNKRARYDRRVSPVFARGESWKRRLPRYAR